jgi:hypothetical protein
MLGTNASIKNMKKFVVIKKCLKPLLTDTPTISWNTGNQFSQLQNLRYDNGPWTYFFDEWEDAVDHAELLAHPSFEITIYELRAITEPGHPITKRI